MSSSRRRARGVPVLSVLTVAAMLASLGLAAPARAAGPQYKVTITSSNAPVQFFGIDNNGDIFGVGNEPGAQTAEGFLLKAGSTTLQFLGSPGDPKNTRSTSDPFGMNDSADIVGYELASLDAPLEWPGTTTPTSLPSPGALPARATGINDSNEIVGFTESNGEKPFIIKGGKASALPVLPNGGFDAEPLGINNAGVVVGDGDTQSADPMAVEWSSSGVISEFAHLPNTLTSQAFAVDLAGVAVGDDILTTDGNAHAVMWANGKVTELNPPGTGVSDAVADAINSSGVIVGGTGTGGFVYRNGTATNLNTLIAPTPGLTLFTATGINDTGVIVGNATLNGRDVGYELTPIS